MFSLPVAKILNLHAGDSFLSLSADIEAAYKEYLANYNNVTVVENGYKQKEALWNEIVRVIKNSAWVHSPSQGVCLLSL